MYYKPTIDAIITCMRKVSPVVLLGIFLMPLLAISCKNSSEEPSLVDDERPVSSLFAEAIDQGTLESDEIDEASGLVVSRSDPSYLWTHNDSGGDPALYLITDVGGNSGKYTIAGASNIDWEDIAVGPGPIDTATYLFIGDIGDNRAVRDSLTIYRVVAPDLTVPNLPQQATLTGAEPITFQYPDGARDAETLMVDPVTRDIYILSKREANIGIYRLPFPQSTSETITAERMGTIPFTNIVAGDISADGSGILIKNYFNVYHWVRSPGESVAVALMKDPSRLNYAAEPQGEAIAWDPDGGSYYTVSEEANGVPAVLKRYARSSQ